MARKAKHDQHSVPAHGYICASCRADTCNDCIDVLRAIFGGEPLCRCKRAHHSGEPTDRQVTDPETGTVWGPGLRVTAEGEVLNGGYSTNDNS